MPGTISSTTVNRKIGIVGTGKLGLCMALCLEKAGYDLYCYDINKEYLTSIKEKTFVSSENDVQMLLDKTDINICFNIKDIIDTCDVIFVFIQTPSLPDGSYDHSHIDSFISECVSYGAQSTQDRHKTLIISSTVMPEYTDSITNIVKDYNYDVCYNPSFIAQGTILYNLEHPDLVLIGSSNSHSAEVVANIHKSIIKNTDTDTGTNTNFSVMSAHEAEIAKIALNCYITTKIAFANMIGDLLVSKNLNPDIVLNAIGSDKRVGNNYLKYGYGFGGPCFPRDNRALGIYGRKNNVNFELCYTTDTLNNEHLLFQFNELKNSTEPIVFNYITYKDNSYILEESQKLKLALLLEEHGCQVIIRERQNVIDILKNTYDNRFNYVVCE
jgi:UDPglucose 6-dehydrogenase